MEAKKIEAILEMIAAKNNTTTSEIRKEILLAMEEGQKSPTTAVRERWAAIPRNGETLTIEELVAYLVRCNYS